MPGYEMLTIIKKMAGWLKEDLWDSYLERIMSNNHRHPKLAAAPGNGYDLKTVVPDYYIR